ncbi:MAG: phage protein Gp36 family protein [Thermotogota bacterium]
MAYVTYEEIIEQAPSLGDANVIAEKRVRALVDAMSSLVDAHLELIYVVPLASPPPMVKQITADLVIGKAYSEITVRSDNAESDEGNRTYDDALDLLRKLRGKRDDPAQPFQPEIFLPGVALRTGIIRTEHDALIWLPKQATGRSLWSNTMDREPRRLPPHA